MKTKQFAKKLSLTKRTVSDLNHSEQLKVKAGEPPTWTLNPSDSPFCRLSAQCQTFCLSNCATEEEWCSACGVCMIAVD